MFNRVMIDTALREIPEFNRDSPFVKSAIDTLEKEMDALPGIAWDANAIKSFLIGFSRGAQYATQLAIDIMKDDKPITL